MSGGAGECNAVIAYNPPCEPPGASYVLRGDELAPSANPTLAHRSAIGVTVSGFSPLASHRERPCTGDPPAHRAILVSSPAREGGLRVLSRCSPAVLAGARPRTIVHARWSKREVEMRE